MRVSVSTRASRFFSRLWWRANNPRLWASQSLRRFATTTLFGVRLSATGVRLHIGLGLLAIGRGGVRVGVTISDYLTGVFAAQAAVSALYARDARGGSGCVIDAALYGSALRILEWTLAGYDRLGLVRSREGNRLANSAPLDNYPTRDGKYVCIVAGSDANFARRRLALRSSRRSPIRELRLEAHTLEIPDALLEERLRVRNRSARAPLLVSVDGRRGKCDCAETAVEISLSPLRLTLLQRETHDHFAVIRTKLRWSGGVAEKS